MTGGWGLGNAAWARGLSGLRAWEVVWGPYGGLQNERETMGVNLYKQMKSMFGFEPKVNELWNPPLKCLSSHRFEMACLFEYAIVPITAENLYDLAGPDEEQLPSEPTRSWGSDGDATLCDNPC